MLYHYFVIYKHIIVRNRCFTILKVKYNKPCFLLFVGHSSLGNLPSLSYGSVYMKLWHGLCSLDNDPHPVVATMSQKVTNHIRNQVNIII